MRFTTCAFLVSLLTIPSYAGADDAAVALANKGASLKTKNVILVTTDGLRWQEVFGGAEKSLMTKKEGGVADVPELTKKYWRETPTARREALMPFLWSKIVSEGQILGNPEHGSDVRVTNGKNFSYPGYSEIFTGKPDPRIDSNDKIPNPNVTVFEWLNGMPELQGKVAAFGSWDVYASILNSERAKFPVNNGYDLLELPETNTEVTLVNQLMLETPRIWGGERFDSFTFRMAKEYLRQLKPRVFYIGLGDSDEFAHEGRYDHYLNSANRVDAYLKELWETLQSMPEYRDTTTMIVSTDHGRGDAEGGEWKGHGAKVKGSERIWMAVIGPDTPALGEAKNTPSATQSQIASTVAAFLGQEFKSFAPEAAPPLESAIKHD